MKLYLFHSQGNFIKFDVKEGVTLEELFTQTAHMPGTRLVLIENKQDSFDWSI